MPFVRNFSILTAGVVGLSLCFIFSEGLGVAASLLLGGAVVANLVKQED